MTTAKELAESVREYVEDEAEMLGQDPDTEVAFDEDDGTYRLTWEAGPSNWALRVAAGQSVYGTDGSDTDYPNPLHVHGVATEPQFSFALEFTSLK